MKLVVLALLLAAASAQPANWAVNVLPYTLNLYLSQPPPLDVNGFDAVMHNMPIWVQDFMAVTKVTTFTLGNRFQPLDDANDTKTYINSIKMPMNILLLGLAVFAGLLQWIMFTDWWHACFCSGHVAKGAVDNVWSIVIRWNWWEGMFCFFFGMFYVFWVPLYKPEIAHYMFRNMMPGFEFFWWDSIALMTVGLVSLNFFIQYEDPDMDKGADSGTARKALTGASNIDDFKNASRHVAWQLFFAFWGLQWMYTSEKLFDPTQSQSASIYQSNLMYVGGALLLVSAILNILSLGFGFGHMYLKKFKAYRVVTYTWMGNFNWVNSAAFALLSLPVVQAPTFLFYTEFESTWQWGAVLFWLIFFWLLFTCAFITLWVSIHYHVIGDGKHKGKSPFKLRLMNSPENEPINSNPSMPTASSIQR